MRDASVQARSLERHGRPAIVLLCLAALVVLGGCGTSGHSATTASSIEGSGINRLAALAGPPVALTPEGLTTDAGQRSFLGSVFADLQTSWKQSFLAAGLSYAPAHLTLFDSEVSTSCGRQSPEVGPFYCPGDHTVYLNLSFFKHLELQFQVSGPVAEAYIVAHEFGHQVQNELAITSRLAAADGADPARKKSRGVSFELQADCLAGVWAHSAYRRSLTPLEIKHALAAAQVLGDDYLARAAESAVDPDSWTHGSSTQREQWVKTGYEGGRAGTCDTFGGSAQGATA